MTHSFAVPRSVEWKETAITILNQQKLPDVTEYLELTTKEDVFDAIVTLKVEALRPSALQRLRPCACCKRHRNR